MKNFKDALKFAPEEIDEKLEKKQCV